ncbi:hypothetical protein [Escherichia coli]|uniref:hypothetical protein n=1 Tax=Escherichia coli TaxID=562 RepID=UPI000AD847B5|nr:hypothetical protein [Escherichia coli]DAU86902.1 MAG TPA: alpha-aminoadipate carrier protein [Caudoviricetes sp.]EEQ6524717.1 hypothetical protein [Escherichia coli]EEQ9687470.1 hypothetical protein [Escherichia coli]EEQ9771969.1 hypothetical protein [Escherichia coli]EFA9668193.1 hypothetical protein [Escherichia coli]
MMMFVKCPACGKYAEKEVPFRIGDKVSFAWQQVSMSARNTRIRITTKTGKITSVNNDSAVVRSRGKDYCLDKSCISPANEPSVLTVRMVGICQCGDV